MSRNLAGTSLSCWALAAAALEMQKVNIYFRGGRDKMSFCFLVTAVFQSVTTVLRVLLSGECVCCYGNGRSFFPQIETSGSPEQRENAGFGAAAALPALGSGFVLG